MSASLATDVQLKVAIVDDDEGIRTSLADVIRHAPPFRLAGDYPSAEVALQEIPRKPPHVALMDVNMPGMKVVDRERHLKAARSQVEVMMMTVYDDSDSLFNYLKTGASRY